MPRAAKSSRQQQREDREWQEALTNRPISLPKELLKQAIANTPVVSQRRSLGIASGANSPTQHRVASSRPLTRISKLASAKKGVDESHDVVLNLPQLPADFSPRTGSHLQTALRSDDLFPTVTGKKLKTYSKSNKTPQVPTSAHPAQEAVVSDKPQESPQEDSEHQSESSDHE